MAAVDFALRAIRSAATRRVPLIMCGPGDLILIAQAIHRHALGDTKPFVVCDPRRREGEASVRSAGNIETGLAAMRRALGGSLCVWSRRLPSDFKEVRLALRDPTTRVQLIVSAESWRHSKPYHVEPIMIPALHSRPQEITRIIDEYADEAAAARSLGMAPISLSRWIGRRALPDRRPGGGRTRLASR